MQLQIRLAILLIFVFLPLYACNNFLSPTKPSNPVGPPAIEQPGITAGIPIVDIISESNNQRRINGLDALTENKKLNAAADYKMRDMFDRQYFDHYGPNGTSGIAELVIKFNYRYMEVGENLAMGHYRDASALVGAWMASPGHRANILRNSYRDIGVATGYNVFEGRRTMIAVQIFGTQRQ